MDTQIRNMLSVQAIPDITGIRTATLMNQQHTVIPCICLVEGVLWPANAPAPELALAEEFGRFPQGWDGRPVTYDHPKVNGIPVAANSPDVLADNAFGQLFNTELKDNKLHTEIWINEARIAELGEEAQATIQNLKDGTGVAEVSTGLFTMSEVVSGTHDGSDYDAIWRNIVPDHLAVLPEGITGACSVEDGCGAPRLNQSNGNTTHNIVSDNWQPVMRAAQMKTNCDCTENNEGDEQVGVFKKLLDLGANFLNFKGNSTGTSDSDIRNAINAGLQAVDDDSYYYILAVFPSSSTQGTFVCEKGWDGKLYENTYIIDAGGSISIGSEPIQVRPQTTFMPVQINVNSPNKEIVMNEKLVNELIANTGTQYTEDDREWLATLDDGQLEKMAPVEIEAEAEADADPAVDTEPTANAQAAPITTNEYIAAAPVEMREVLAAGVELHRNRKAALVSALKANARCTFTEAQLNGKSVEELESIVAMAPDITFEAAAPAVTQNAEAELNYTPAPDVFTTAVN